MGQYTQIFTLNKQMITSSSTISLLTLCSSKKDFKTHVSHMKEWYLALGSSETVVNSQIDKVVFGRGQSVTKNLESGNFFCYYLSH